MKIGIDGHWMRAMGKGNQRFLVQFLREFATLRQDRVELTVFVDHRRAPHGLPAAATIRYEPVRVVRDIEWELRGFSDSLRAIGADAGFSHSDRARASTPLAIRVSEIPDHRIAINARSAGLYQRASDQLTRFLAKGTYGRARALAATSEATKREIVERYRIDPGKIHVIPNGLGAGFSPLASLPEKQCIREAFGAPHGYLLHFSSDRDPRDNTVAVLEAFHRALPALGARKLLIAGVDRLTAFGTAEKVRERGLEGSVACLGRVPDDDVVRLYQAADAYVDPSLFEGFGIQIIEAQKSGVPVVCSNTTCLPEVAGAGALLVDPHDVVALAEAMEAAALDEPLREALVAKGSQNVERFGWGRITHGMMELFEEIGR